MKIPESVPVGLALEARGKNEIAVKLDVERGWRFWLPKQVEVTVDGAGSIWLYQTLHKLMRDKVEERGWTPNVAGAAARLRAAIKEASSSEPLTPERKESLSDQMSSLLLEEEMIIGQIKLALQDLGLKGGT